MSGEIELRSGAAIYDDLSPATRLRLELAVQHLFRSGPDAIADALVAVAGGNLPRLFQRLDELRLDELRGVEPPADDEGNDAAAERRARGNAKRAARAPTG
jgi:hypothetical protein